jgi:hypothetical protein
MRPELVPLKPLKECDPSKQCFSCPADVALEEGNSIEQ